MFEGLYRYIFSNNLTSYIMQISGEEQQSLNKKIVTPEVNQYFKCLKPVNPNTNSASSIKF